LFYLQVSLSGALAGFLTWIITPEGNPWNLFENFQTGLLANGLFAGLFIGLISALPVLINEKRLLKSLGFLISASTVGLAINMLAVVVFTIIGEVVLSHIVIDKGILRFFWWFFLSCSFSICFAILYHDLKQGCRALMGLTPGFIFAGTLLDRFFIKEQRWLLSYVFFGLVCAICFAIVWDLLKESWLDENPGSLFMKRYYIDEAEFVAGGLDECELSLDGMPENVFSIIEREGIHTLEVLDDKMLISINNCRFRYRVLIDGDVIAVGGRSFVYHSKLARSRDILPEAAA
jgi:hypothetical protein